MPVRSHKAAHALTDDQGVGLATAIWFAAQVDLTAAVYENPDSLIWRDAGCVLTTLTYVAAALGLT